MANDQIQQPRRLWRILFAVSLALNIAVVGVVVGFGLRDKSGGPGPRGFDVALGPIGRALEVDDRRAISQALMRNPDLRADQRGNTRQLMTDFGAALRAVPFSQDALQDVLTQATGRMSLVQDAARTALIDQIGKMTASERAALADRIENMRRSNRRNEGQ